jgi:hypothetical protein
MTKETGMATDVSAIHLCWDENNEEPITFLGNFEQCSLQCFIGLSQHLHLYPVIMRAVSPGVKQTT